MEQWHLHIRTKEIEDDESLVKDMANLSNNTKMLAIAAVAILIENESRSCLEPVSRTTSKYVVPSSTRRVSEELLEELERLLDDDAVHVRVPSAITLYARGMQSKKVSISHPLAIIQIPILLFVSGKGCTSFISRGGNTNSGTLGSRPVSGVCWCPLSHHHLRAPHSFEDFVLSPTTSKGCPASLYNQL